MKKKSMKMSELVKDIATFCDDDIIIFNDIRKLALLDVPLSSIVSDTNVVLYCACGSIGLDVNDEHYSISERQILICPPMANLSNYTLSEDCYCHGLSFSSDVLLTALKNNIDIWNKCLYVDKVNVITLSEESEDLWVKYYDLMAAKIMSEVVNTFDHIILHNMIHACILELCGRMVLNASELMQKRMNQNLNQSSTIFHNFIELLDHTPVKYHPVDYYAEQLFVTPKYLANVCRKESGMSAIAWIQDRVIHDIRYLLAKPNLTIKEVTAQLGFDTVSLFGRFVRTHMGGTSPRKLRKTIIK